jgi:putative transposase
MKLDRDERIGRPGAAREDGLGSARASRATFGAPAECTTGVREIFQRKEFPARAPEVRAGLASAREGACAPKSPESAPEIYYSKRRLPHFERPWANYAVSFSTHQRHLLSPNERGLVLQSLCYGHDHQQYELYVACVMPDHVHLLFEPQIKNQDLAARTIFWSLTEILHGIKSSTAHRINRMRRTRGPVWEKESFDRLIRSESDLQEKFSYICRNPWDSKVANQNQDYPLLWTQETFSARAPKTAREGACAPQTGRAAQSSLSSATRRSQ